MIRFSLLILAALVPCAPAAGDVLSRLAAKTFTGKNGDIPYRIHVPPNIDGRVPLILFLHGAGERGDDNAAPLKHGIEDILDWCEETKNPAVVLVPQCPREKSWASLDRKTMSLAKDAAATTEQELVMELLEEVKDTVKVDPRRLYVTGLSMGGYGTWDLLRRHPDAFAAAIPICGGGHPGEAARIRDIPVWVFHGAMDKVVPAEQSRRMVKALEDAGSTKVKYTEYPDAGHDSWSMTYADPDVLKWLFAQTR
ncbi:MAG: prolyl oligopeptidase family serine peptidase [Akkermansiaceae bacterium]|nr:prolyl oligopeptidase family serine peptidase [Akkermansiaceae bacterium]NNM30571.1 prolyl oligopeptidase family serine peptidase [Akkermansiaceae bacterium]